MPKSAAFVRIKADVLAITRAIPAGRVTSFRAIGYHLDVVPRHVAYILATLTDAEQAQTPWHRVVSDTGALDRPKHDGSGQSQAELLAAEGVRLDQALRIVDMDLLFFAISEESTGVAAGTRPNAAALSRA
jgi:methylated-DNA-protein-cysteine methyltransferase related protein